MDTQPPQPGPSGSKSSQLAGVSSNTSLIGTQQEHRHQLVHLDAAKEGTKNMSQDAHSKIIRKTGSSTNKKQHAVSCEYIHTVVNGCQLTVYRTVGVRSELHDQYIAARNGKPHLSTKAFVCTACETEHHDDVSSGTFIDEFLEQQPQEWAKQAVITLEEAMEAYMVEVIAASYCLRQQRIPCRCSTCLLQWQGREVVYSWNSPTCAWPRKDFRAPQ